MALVTAIDLVAPLASLEVEIVPVLEGAAREEVSFDEPKRAFDSGGAIFIQDFMSAELKAVALSESRHLRHGHHLGTGTAQDNHMRVIDHDDPRGTVKVFQGLGEKDLAVKALKGGVALEEEHAGVAQHGRGGLDFAALASEIHQMGGGIVLDLLGGLEVIASGRHDRLLPDTLTAAEGREGRVGDL